MRDTSGGRGNFRGLNRWLDICKKNIYKEKDCCNKENHNVIVEKGLDTCIKIVTCKISSTYHLQKKKNIKSNFLFVLKNKIKSIKMGGTWTMDTTTI